VLEYDITLLRAVDGIHSAGIIHRDIKPRNILINPIRDMIEKKQQENENHQQQQTSLSLVLIDFGLSDFYIPNTLYSVRVSSKYYKSPELLCNVQNYDYSIDMWSIGCILASLLFRTKDPFFASLRQHNSWPKIDIAHDKSTADKLHQLYSIISILGIPKFLQYIEKYNISFPEDIEQTIEIWKKQHEEGQVEQNSDYDKDDNGTSFIDKVLQNIDIDLTIQRQLQEKQRNSVKQYNLDDLENGIDLIKKLLVYDPDDRYTAKQAMEHQYFQNLFSTMETLDNLENEDQHY
jgi:casein kinase II subunit alpha